MKKNSSLKIPGGYMFRKKITPWCILALPMAFTIWLKYYPIFSAFFISLFRYDPINPPGQFAGLQNYIGMFGMQHYWDAWKNYLPSSTDFHVLFHPAHPGASVK